MFFEGLLVPKEHICQRTLLPGRIWCRSAAWSIYSLRPWSAAVIGQQQSTPIGAPSSTSWLGPRQTPIAPRLEKPASRASSMSSSCVVTARAAINVARRLPFQHCGICRRSFAALVSYRRYHRTFRISSTQNWKPTPTTRPRSVDVRRRLRFHAANICQALQRGQQDNRLDHSADAIPTHV